MSKWENPTRLNTRLAELISSPIAEINQEALDQTLTYFETKCKKSKEIYLESTKFIPGGIQHNLSFNFPFPICIDKRKGSYLYDIDGNRYIDFLKSGGADILGYPIISIKNKIIELLNECGPMTGMLHEAELLIAKEINRHMPFVEMFRMLGSGTESVMAALRIARIATNKKRIIKIGGAYHGWSDQMVYGLKIAGSRSFLETYGIPKSCYKYTDEVRNNDLDMLEKMLKLNKIRGGTAAVIVEPLGPESGTRLVDFDYNKGVRALCDKYRCLLIFDEVVTAFRVGLSGAQGCFGVQPDLTLFGKIIAGGYPGAGGVGGKRKYIELMAAGVATGKKHAYVGGTFAANPLSSLAGYLTIKEIEKTGACQKASLAGDKLADGLKQLIEKYQLPYVIYNQGSIVHLESTGVMSYDFSSFNAIKSAICLLKHKKVIIERKEAMERMSAAYMANGIITLAGSRLFTSLADTNEVINDALNRFEDVFKNVVGTDKGLTKLQMKRFQQNKSTTLKNKQINKKGDN